ncbi:MAG: hypothetical protein K2R93_16215 [Gemmatimonadaceae bacterium]|nr:hypothetical protein [Gemmatimonadaceae bacterium]
MSRWGHFPVCGRALVIAAFAIGAARSTAAAQNLPNVTGQAVVQGADTVFREATRTLTKGNYRRAAGLFAALRLTYPRSPYVPDSYYWQAFALQRIDEPTLMQQALMVLDEQQLRFPEAAGSDDVLALRARVESVVAQLPPRTPEGAPCADREDAAAMAALSTLTMLSDPQVITGYLATLLAMRTPCATELRRSAVYLLAQRLDADGRRMLEVVVTRDPSEQVRRDAQLALAKAGAVGTSALTTVAQRLPPRRAPADTAAVFLGDTALVGRVTLGPPRDGRVSVRLPRPAQLVVLSLTLGEAPILLAPDQPKNARLLASGPIPVDLRPADLAVTATVIAGSSSLTDTDALRREAAIEACLSRQTAQLQAEFDRQFRADPNKNGRKVAINPAGGRVDYAGVGGASQAYAAASCATVASRTAPAPPATTILRQSLTASAPNDRYLVVLAVARPLSMPWLLVRLGTMRLSGATVPEVLQQLTGTLFDGHPGAWSGTVIPW